MDNLRHVTRLSYLLDLKRADSDLRGIVGIPGIPAWQRRRLAPVTQIIYAGNCHTIYAAGDSVHPGQFVRDASFRNPREIYRLPAGLFDLKASALERHKRDCSLIRFRENAESREILESSKKEREGHVMAFGFRMKDEVLTTHSAMMSFPPSLALSGKLIQCQRICWRQERRVGKQSETSQEVEIR